MKRVFKFLWILIGKPAQEVLLCIAGIAAFVLVIQGFGAWLYFAFMQELPNFMQSLVVGAMFVMGAATLLGIFIGLCEFKKACKRAWRKAK